MVRPHKIKDVSILLDVTYFKPRGVPLHELEEVEITVDELETLRLSNIEGLLQDEAASRMNVHQSTFQRTLKRARNKVTDALVNGKAIRIHGGEYRMVDFGRGMGPGRRAGSRPAGGAFGGGRGVKGARGRGRLGGPLSAGPGGACKCPNCGYEKEHLIGQPCLKMACPKCKTMMVRG